MRINGARSAERKTQPAVTGQPWGCRPAPSRRLPPRCDRSWVKQERQIAGKKKDRGAEKALRAISPQSARHIAKLHAPITLAQRRTVPFALSRFASLSATAGACPLSSSPPVPQTAHSARPLTTCLSSGSCGVSFLVVPSAFIPHAPNSEHAGRSPGKPSDPSGRPASTSTRCSAPGRYRRDVLRVQGNRAVRSKQENDATWATSGGFTERSPKAGQCRGHPEKGLRPVVRHRPHSRYHPTYRDSVAGVGRPHARLRAALPARPTMETCHPTRRGHGPRLRSPAPGFRATATERAPQNAAGQPLGGTALAMHR